MLRMPLIRLTLKYCDRSNNFRCNTNGMLLCSSISLVTTNCRQPINVVAAAGLTATKTFSLSPKIPIVICNHGAGETLIDDVVAIFIHRSYDTMILCPLSSHNIGINTASGPVIGYPQLVPKMRFFPECCHVFVPTWDSAC